MATAESEPLALSIVLGVLLRMIPGYCKDNDVEQCTDEEHNAAIEVAARRLYGPDATQWPKGVILALSGAYDDVKCAGAGAFKA